MNCMYIYFGLEIWITINITLYFGKLQSYYKELQDRKILLLLIIFLKETNCSFKRHVLFTLMHIATALKKNKSNVMQHTQYFSSNYSINHQNNQ